MAKKLVFNPFDKLEWIINLILSHNI
jgi:hypothetical protein